MKIHSLIDTDDSDFKSHCDCQFQDLILYLISMWSRQELILNMMGNFLSQRSQWDTNILCLLRGGKKNERRGDERERAPSTPTLRSFNTFTHFLELMAPLAVFCHRIRYRFVGGYRKKINFGLPRRQSPHHRFTVFTTVYAWEWVSECVCACLHWIKASSTTGARSQTLD